MSEFKEKFNIKRTEHQYKYTDRESFENGVEFALEEVINVLWSFGIDEATKKMMVRNMLIEIKNS